MIGIGIFFSVIGLRMRIIEIFFAGQQPTHRPTTLPEKIRIDTS